MPLYDASCSKCGTTVEVWRSMAERDHLGSCDCGGERYRIFIPPRAMSDIDGYVSPIDGKWVGSRSEHRDHMRRHGVMELGNEKPTLGKRETEIPKAAIRQTIKDTVERMKSDGRWRER